MTTNRDLFKKLYQDALITQAKAAELIAAQTERPCSIRTVRAWLADPALPSARACPDWAIQALTKRLKKEKLGTIAVDI